MNSKTLLDHPTLLIVQRTSPPQIHHKKYQSRIFIRTRFPVFLYHEMHSNTKRDFGSDKDFHTSPFQYAKTIATTHSSRILDTDDIGPVERGSPSPIITRTFRNSLEQHEDSRDESRSRRYRHRRSRLVFLLGEESEGDVWVLQKRREPIPKMRMCQCLR